MLFLQEGNFAGARKALIVGELFLIIADRFAHEGAYFILLFNLIFDIRNFLSNIS